MNNVQRASEFPAVTSYTYSGNYEIATCAVTKNSISTVECTYNTFDSAWFESSGFNHCLVYILVHKVTIGIMKTAVLHYNKKYIKCMLIISCLVVNCRFRRLLCTSLASTRVNMYTK